MRLLAVNIRGLCSFLVFFFFFYFTFFFQCVKNHFLRLDVLDTIFFFMLLGIFSLRFSRLASFTACLCACCLWSQRIVAATRLDH